MAQLPNNTRNTDKFKAWLTANGINLSMVPVDAVIYVKDDQLWYEEFKQHRNGARVLNHEEQAFERTTKWVFHSVRIEDI